jgi:type IV pilus assembly protein PilP
MNWAINGTSTKYMGLLASFISLTGCIDDSRYDDLDKNITEIHAGPLVTPESLPIYPSAELFSYSAHTLRSPFNLKRQLIKDDSLSGTAIVAPDEDRLQEPLERFDITALSMVGSLSTEAQIWGLINDGQGKIYRVALGNYIGRNLGVLVDIDERELAVLEIVRDGRGGWVNRSRTLTINSD